MKTADIEYDHYGMFTGFTPNTPDGEKVWNELAGMTDGTGKVLKIHHKKVIKGLREAGYIVRKAKPVTEDMDSILDELISLGM